VRLHDPAQLCSDVVGRGQDGILLTDQGFHGAKHDLLQQRLLGLHVVVEAGRTQAQSGRDVLHAGAVIPALSEQGEGSLADVGRADRAV
jgi:hypothetical protein